MRDDARRIMQHNDVLRSVRYILNARDAAIIDWVHLADPTFEITLDDVVGYLKKEDEEGFVSCPDAVLARALDGVVFHLRGRDPTLPQRPFDRIVNNNAILKKLRVAFELKEEDLHQILASVDFPVSKPELSALFRGPEQKNFRACGDQLLRNFLKGLALRKRGGGSNG